ncbi:MAG: hypothetical protein E3J37_04460 [Anaerolineales bacterium]|nr:MAG: hypothetical protein E3J37_04460 [Anaerolineales bacterium]
MQTLLRKELREQWRTYRFLVVVAVLIVSGMIGPLSVKYLPLILAQMPGVPEGLMEVMPEPDVAMAVDEYVQNLSQLGVILAILIPMAAVVGEKTSGTAALILSKPVSRAVFLGAKLIAHGLIFFAGILLAGLGGYYYLGILFEWLTPVGFLALNGLLMTYLMMFLAITLFASTISRSQFAAAGISFGLLIFLSLLGAVPSLSPYLPTALMAWGRALVLRLDVEPAWGALGVTFAIIVSAFLGGLLVFRHQEI